MKGISKDAKMMIAIAMLVVFAGYYFLIKPQSAEVALARSDREGVEQQVDDAQSVLQLADGAVEEVAPDDDAEAPAGAIPPDDQLADLLRQLKVIADTTGLVHSSISPSPVGPNPNGPGGSIQIAITATGSHDAARAYLAELTAMPRLVLIEQIGLHVGAEQSAQLQLSARVFTQSAPTAVTP